MNEFGRVFRVSIFGESHGNGVGVLISGCPAGLPLTVEEFSQDLMRRQGGNQVGTTPRKEADVPTLQTGVFNNFTTGAPLSIWFPNENVRSKDYDKVKDLPRPGHADLTGRAKFGGFNDYRGGGHFSARLTTGIVAAGVVAKKLLKDVKISAKVTKVHGTEDIDRVVAEALADGDSVGGIIECKASGLPLGLGEPFWDSIESLIAHAIFAIPATKGIEFGTGFRCAEMRGSEFNDDILDTKGNTATNHAGGINGGISNGNELVFRIAIKPPASIKKNKNTVSFTSGEQTQISVEGRHDACVALRAPVIVEAMTALVLADLSLLQQQLPRVI